MSNRHQKAWISNMTVEDETILTFPEEVYNEGGAYFSNLLIEEHMK